MYAQNASNMMRHVLVFLAVLLVIASCGVAANENKAELAKKEDDAKKKAIVDKYDNEDDDDVEYDVTVPSRVAQMIADEMENADEDEIESMEDEKIGNRMEDAWWRRRRRSGRRRHIANIPYH